MQEELTLFSTAEDTPEAPSPEIPYGYCQCGCGEETSLYPYSKPKYGIKKGEPNRFLRGHRGFLPRKPMSPRNTVEGVWKLVKKEDGNGCWEFMAGKSPDGYGKYRITALNEQLAHRIAWISANGPIPHDMCVLHKCDNPSCCRPEHLFTGTRKDNNDDKMKKGRNVALNGVSHIRAIFSEDDIRSIREWHSVGTTIADIARSRNCSEGAIRHIIKGRSWHHVK